MTLIAIDHGHVNSRGGSVAGCRRRFWLRYCGRSVIVAAIAADCVVVGEGMNGALHLSLEKTIGESKSITSGEASKTMSVFCQCNPSLNVSKRFFLCFEELFISVVPPSHYRDRQSD